jgi:hypothetical protein
MAAFFMKQPLYRANLTSNVVRQYGHIGFLRFVVSFDSKLRPIVIQIYMMWSHRRMADPPMNQEYEPLAASARSKAGHYEILGETYAKFEFFENGWNPYSRFLDVDKVDLILRRKTPDGNRLYREVQVKFGKLYEVGPAWERGLFDFTSWRFYKEDEFANQLNHKDFFVAYILARDIGYNRDIFIFPVRDFVEKVIRSAIPSGNQRKVYISRLKGDSERWVLRRMGRFTDVNDETCLDGSEYRRNFSILEK